MSIVGAMPVMRYNWAMLSHKFSPFTPTISLPNGDGTSYVAMRPNRFPSRRQVINACMCICSTLVLLYKKF